MLTQEEITQALELESKAEQEAKNDTLDFLEIEGEEQREGKNQENGKKVIKPTLLEKIDIDKVLINDEEENILKIDFKNEGEEEDSEFEGLSDEEISEISVAQWLNQRLGLGFKIDEEALSDFTSDEILDNVIEEIKQNTIKEYTSKLEEKTYKTEESYLLDVFLNNGGTIEDFIEYYNKQKQNFQDFDNLLEEIKSYSPEQLLYVSLIEEGFTDEEAIDYIDKISKKGALEDEYEKQIKKIERIVENNKSEHIKKNLETIAQEQREERLREYEELENSKIEIADYLSKIDNVVGFILDDNKKERLFEFLTEQDEEGYTAYDRYLQSNKNLLTQAIFAMFGEEIIKTIESLGNERGKRNFFTKLPSSPFIANKRQNVQQVNLDKLNEF